MGGSLGPAGWKSLQNKLELKTGLLAGALAFRVRLDPTDSGSWWNHEQKLISIGCKDHPAERREGLCWLLSAHEVSHALFTQPLSVELNKAQYKIWNVLEDARVDDLMGRKYGIDYGPLCQFEMQKYYCGEENPTRATFVGVGVIRHRRRWGVSGFDPHPTVPQELVKDWDDAIDAAIKADNSGQVLAIAMTLYEKWKQGSGPQNEGKGQDGKDKRDDEKREGQGDGKADGGSKKRGADDYRKELEAENKDEGEEVGIREQNQDAMVGKGKPIEVSGESSKLACFSWDHAWIQREEALVRRYLVFPDDGATRYGMSGRRLVPARADNPPLAPFRSKKNPERKTRPFRMLAVIDASGSMYGPPFKWAAHTVKLLHTILGDKLSVAVTGSQFPQPVEIKDLEELRRIEANGKTENYRSLQEVPFRQRLTLFLSDARVCREEDKQYVKGLKARGAKVACGYVGTHGNKLREVFGEGITFESATPDGVGRLVGLFLKSRFGRDVMR